jgi:hypothetical protein
MAVTINGTTGIDTPSLTADTTTLVVDETNNRVGIGTATPSTDLEVSGSKIKITNASGGAQFQGSANGGGMYFDSIGSTTDMIFRQTGSFTERMRIDSSGNLKFNSGYGSAATAYGCRAWVKFQGSGAGPSLPINGSGNVSSVGDNGTGDYTMNFSTSMPDVAYSCVASGHENIGTYTRDLVPAGNYATSSVRLRIYGGLYDIDICNVAIFR